MTARLCMYRGPASGLRNTLGHWAVCVLTMSPYSHVEVQIDGVCYSSSFRDGGVRAKVIEDLQTSGHWDLFPIDIDEAAAIARFKVDEGKPYDWLGMLRVSPLLRWMRRIPGKRFCSEEVIWMATAPADPEIYSPRKVLATLVRPS